MAAVDPNAEWIGNVQPTGLVVAASVLARHGLNPAEQTRADTEVVRALLSADDDGPALRDPWAFFGQILGWRSAQVAGAPGGPSLPAELSIRIEESTTDLSPDWAVTDPEKGWQILVRLEGAGIDPDKRGELKDWEATPHQQFERLLRETGVSTGILLSDTELRLIHAPRGETSGWLKFPLRSLGDVGGRPMLGGLKLTLSSFRLRNDAPDRRLKALLKSSRDAQAEVSTKLASQVLGALHELLRGLHSADRSRIEALAANRPEHLYEGLLTVLLRLVFPLYAEDRDLIPSRADGEARALYDQGYGVRSLYSRLLEDAARYPDTMDERRGAWARLLALFRLVHRGDGTGWILGRGGKLFDPGTFPFLQGQDVATDPAAPSAVSDGCILRILDSLLSLEGEKLSYRTLDVEQIGSVYETVMGFTVETRPGPALAIRAGKNDRTPVFVDVGALIAKKRPERAKFLKETADRNSVTDKVGKPLAAATDLAGAVAALRPIVDERGSPGGQVAAPGTPLLQPTDERRRTGSHYTPRSLTEPIVRRALEPVFERIGPDATPAQILELKVCDPTMGSGAFLVEACRALAGRLMKAWERWPDKKPITPPDEDAELYAKRLVAQRCLYGVDKNPLATDLAKLSLWLATLARDHEFTFLDHALKSGDSLVGLTRAQIAAAHWDTAKPGLPLFRQLVRDRVAEAMRGREEIQTAPDDIARAVQEQRHRLLEDRLKDIRIMGDAVIAAFFAEDKPKTREKRRSEVESWLCGLPVAWDKIVALATMLKKGIHTLPPFHWEIEFPEVFVRDDGGFDAILGNPPFLGGSNISGRLGDRYLSYIKESAQGAGNRADLVSYFFQRSLALLSNSGVCGLIATNTIRQGDTREASTAHIIRSGGSIFSVVKRFVWPGEAAVIVSIIHFSKSEFQGSKLIDGRVVRQINSFLIGSQYEGTPPRLATNLEKTYKGLDVYGAGFIFDDRDKSGGSSPIQAMTEIQAVRPASKKRIFPYVGGQEINSDPLHAGHRFVFDLDDLTEEQAKQQFPELMDIAERKIRPERLKLRDNAHGRRLKAYWWRYNTGRHELFSKLQSFSDVLVVCRVSPQYAVARVRTGQKFSDSLIVFLLESFASLTALQSRPHELWTRFFASSLKDDLRYTPSDCFETFPFPIGFETNATLEHVGRAYHDHRAELMVSRGEGMTKTYNRFNDPAETAEDIRRLRELHAAIDRAVLESYGWHDLAARAAPMFLDETCEDDHTYQGRLFWPADLRDEVLTRLLGLNAQRHAEEIRLGTAPVMTGKIPETDEVEAEEVA
jgi:hypothetical protein